MSAKKLPLPPPGMKYIFRPWRKCPDTGKLLYAKTYGFKAWPILVSAF